MKRTFAHQDVRNILFGGNEFYEEVEHETTGTWRWGVLKRGVYKDIRDGTFWAFDFRTQPEEGIVEWEDEAIQVERRERMIVDWVPV